MYKLTIRLFNDTETVLYFDSLKKALRAGVVIARNNLITDVDVSNVCTDSFCYITRSIKYKNCVTYRWYDKGKHKRFYSNTHKN